MIKRHIAAPRFLSYYFREMPKIADWAKSNGLVDFSFLRIHPSLSRDFKKRLDEIVVRSVFPVYPHVEKILNEGWRWGVLSIREYNLVVYLADFYRKIIAVEQSKAVSRPDFTKMEEAFFKIVCRGEYPATLISVFSKIIPTVDDASGKELSAIATRLECFFQPNCLRPSLFDLILAFNMCFFNKFLTWSDLMRPNLSDIVQGGYFDCTIDVFTRMIDFIQYLERTISSLRREKATGEWLRETIGAQSPEIPESIGEFYAESGHNWTTDSSDAFLLALTLIRGTVERMQRLIHEEWQVMTNSEKTVVMRVVTDDKLGAESDRLVSSYDLANTRYKRLARQDFPLSRMIVPENRAPLFASDSQRFIHGKISAALSALYTIAHSLKDLSDGKVRGYQPDFFITHMVVSPPQWRGRSLYDVLGSTAELFVRICGLFHVAALEHDIARVELLEKKLDTLEKEKKALDSSGALAKHMKTMERA